MPSDEAPEDQCEICKVAGQKAVGCEKHFTVEWKGTWMPESESEVEVKARVGERRNKDRSR